MTVPVEGYPDVSVRVRFLLSLPAFPEVFAHSPPSAHRFEDSTLCMWFWKDGPDHVWLFREGLVALLAYVAAHLFRELWWDEYGEWLGDEVPHGPISSDDEKRAA